MITKKIPVFEKGKILTKAMLDGLRDHLADFLELSFFSFKDGILKGFTPFNKPEEPRELFFSPGILKHKGKLLFVDSEISISLPTINGSFMVYLKCGELKGTQCEDGYFRFSEIDFSCSKEQICNPDMIELCRFDYDGQTTLLETSVGKFSSLTNNNTVNLIYTLWADVDKSGTIAPQILKLFANELIELEVCDASEYAFAFQCLNSERVSRECILAFLKTKGLSLNFDKSSNEEILQVLGKILKQRKKNDASVQIENRNSSENKIRVS